MLRDAFWLTLIFGGTAVVALWYYQIVPSAEHLRQRLPNTRPTLASLLLTAVLGIVIWWIWQSAGGFRRFSTILSLLFNLLIFETFLLWLMRWLRSNTLAVMASLGIVSVFVWLQREVGGVLVYNLTFITATFGATTLLIRLGYLRTKFLALITVLWMVYDILGVLFIYPNIYLVSDRPVTSFFFPAVAVGKVTLGSGDFMFLVLMGSVLLRDRGWRWAVVHIIVQSLALFITVLLKPDNVLLPYLTVMVPIWLLIWWWSKPKVNQKLLQPA